MRINVMDFQGCQPFSWPAILNNVVLVAVVTCPRLEHLIVAVVVGVLVVFLPAHERPPGRIWQAIPNRLSSANVQGCAILKFPWQDDPAVVLQRNGREHVPVLPRT